METTIKYVRRQYPPSFNYKVRGIGWRKYARNYSIIVVATKRRTKRNVILRKVSCKWCRMWYIHKLRRCIEISCLVKEEIVIVTNQRGWTKTLPVWYRIIVMYDIIEDEYHQRERERKKDYFRREFHCRAFPRLFLASLEKSVIEQETYPFNAMILYCRVRIINVHARSNVENK